MPVLDVVFCVMLLVKNFQNIYFEIKRIGFLPEHIFKRVFCLKKSSSVLKMYLYKFKEGINVVDTNVGPTCFFPQR